MTAVVMKILPPFKYPGLRVLNLQQYKTHWRRETQSTFGYGHGCLGNVHFQMNVLIQSKTFESIGYQMHHYYVYNSEPKSIGQLS